MCLMQRETRPISKRQCASEGLSPPRGWAEPRGPVPGSSLHCRAGAGALLLGWLGSLSPWPPCLLLGQVLTAGPKRSPNTWGSPGSPDSHITVGSSLVQFPARTPGTRGPFDVSFPRRVGRHNTSSPQRLPGPWTDAHRVIGMGRKGGRAEQKRPRTSHGSFPKLGPATVCRGQWLSGQRLPG